MRTSTILHMIYHAPITTLSVLLGRQDRLAIARKDYATILLAMIIIAACGIVMNYLRA